LDLDWMYPTQRGGSFVDKVNYITLLRELDEALHSNDMLLMVGVSAARDIIDAAYDIPAMVPYVDLVNVMTYDYYGSWDPYTQHQSGLYPYPGETGVNLI
ncbi:chitinase, partial [Streptococcus thermophilus]|nr:chitinase [Streptococcus thermophilus]